MSRHGNCAPNLSVLLSLHSLTMHISVNILTTGTKLGTCVQSAAAVAITGGYEICSKITCLPHRHAKQPASRTNVSGSRFLSGDLPPLGTKELAAGQNWLEVIWAWRRSPPWGAAVSHECLASLPALGEAVSSHPGDSVTEPSCPLPALKFLCPGNISWWDGGGS